MNGQENLVDLLDQLHGIVEPPPVSMWPATPAWIVVGLILLGIIGFGLWHWLRRRRANAYRRAALSEFKRLLPDLRASRPSALPELELLLRRTAIAAFPRPDVAALTGADWTQFLDRTGPSAPGFAGQAGALQAGTYAARPASYDGPALAAAAESWIRHHHV